MTSLVARFKFYSEKGSYNIKERDNYACLLGHFNDLLFKNVDHSIFSTINKKQYSSDTTNSVELHYELVLALQPDFPGIKESVNLEILICRSHILNPFWTIQVRLLSFLNDKNINGRIGKETFSFSDVIVLPKILEELKIIHKNIIEILNNVQDDIYLNHWEQSIISSDYVSDTLDTLHQQMYRTNWQDKLQIANQNYIQIKAKSI